MLQTDVCERLTCQDRFDDIRRKRGQLQHTPDVAAVDALLFGDVLEVFELPRFQLLLPCVRFGQGSQQRVVRDRSFNGIRFDTVSQNHLPAIAAIEPDGNGNYLKRLSDCRRNLMPSGQSKVFSNRVGWVKTHLKNAGLVDNPSRGQVRLSDRGRQVLAQSPVSIDMKFLRQYDGYRSFIGEIQSDEAIASDSVQDSESSQSTPLEQFEASFSTLRAALAE